MAGKGPHERAATALRAQRGVHRPRHLAADLCVVGISRQERAGGVVAFGHDKALFTAARRTETPLDVPERSQSPWCRGCVRHRQDRDLLARPEPADRVVDLAVNEGDPVKEGQDLVIVERA